MNLPNLSKLKNLPFNQKVSLLSLAILILVLPFLSQSAQTRVELRKNAQETVTSSDNSDNYGLFCHPTKKALVEANLDQQMTITAVLSGTNYNNIGFRITLADGSSYFTDNYPITDMTLYYPWWNRYYMYKTTIPRPISDPYSPFRIEFYVNHVSGTDSGEPCGEFFTPMSKPIYNFPPSKPPTGCNFDIYTAACVGLCNGCYPQIDYNGNTKCVCLSGTPTPTIRITPTFTPTPTPTARITTVTPTPKPTTMPTPVANNSCTQLGGVCCKAVYGSSGGCVSGQRLTSGSTAAGCNPSGAYPQTGWCCKTCVP